VKGLDSASLPTRRQIVTRLQERTAEPILFPVDGDGPTRQAAARELANRWTIEPWWKSGELTASSNNLTAEAVLDDVTRTLGEAVAEGRPLTGDERERLTSHGSGGITALETAARQSPQFRELAEPLLRTASESYALLDKFSDKEVTVRRSAALKLVALGEQQSLSRDFLVALRQRLLHEQDRQVWFAILQLLRNEPGDEAAAVAMLAVHQPWPDLRSLGADYVGRHPQPERAMWLLPLLGDPDPAVQEAAAHALGACQNPRALDGLPASDSGEPALPGLRSLLTSQHANVEWTAITAMASLGDEQATSELLRRALDPHPRARERVIRTMGETGNRRLVDSLIEMGWTERDPQVLQAILWSLDRLVPQDQRDAELIRAGGLAASAPIEDKIRMWADWQARRKSAAR
jgi:HEAT repeat protein